MSDVIPKPGKYQQFNGKPADVKWVGEGKALGFDSNGEETLWNSVTGKWHGTAMPDFHFHITGPWHPDPPDPPEGFVVQDRETYRYGCEDRHCNYDAAWVGPYVTMKGMTASELDARYPAEAPFYIASPIPKPFRISDHGPGVYETRDGRETLVRERLATEAWHKWRGMFVYGDNGGVFSDGAASSDDLVRYLRPLPQPEPKFKVGDRVRWKSDVDVASWIRGQRGEVVALTPVFTVSRDGTPYATKVEYVELDADPQPEWTPTNELRWSEIPGWECGAVYVGSHDKTSPRFRRIEQRWTNGTDSEWRPVTVDG